MTIEERANAIADKVDAGGRGAERRRRVHAEALKMLLEVHVSAYEEGKRAGKALSP